MPVFSGQLVMTLTDTAGFPVFVVTEFWNPADGTLRDGTTSTSRGNRTGAVIIDNQTGRAQKLNVSGTILNVSVNGDVYTAAQLATQGYTTLSDISTLSPEVV